MVQIVQIRCQRLETHITRQTDIIQISLGPSAGNEGLTWPRHAVNCFSADFTSGFAAFCILPTLPRCHTSGGHDDFCQLCFHIFNSSKNKESIENLESDFSGICLAKYQKQLTIFCAKCRSMSPLYAMQCSVDQNQCRTSIHRFHNRLYNHGEGPYQGLLLVESGYYRFHI